MCGIKLLINDKKLRLLQSIFPPIKTTRKGALPSTIIMMDETRLKEISHPLTSLGRNVAIIVRAKNKLIRQQTLNNLMENCKRRHFKILVSDDFALAKLADGLHIPENRLKQGAAMWRRFRPLLGLVTTSAHSSEAIQRASKWGVDGIIVSPVFQTISHPDKPSLGLLRFARLCHKNKSPIIALGGVKLKHARILRKAGAVGICGTGVFLPDKEIK